MVSCFSWIIQITLWNNITNRIFAKELRRVRVARRILTRLNWTKQKLLLNNRNMAKMRFDATFTFLYLLISSLMLSLSLHPQRNTVWLMQKSCREIDNDESMTSTPTWYSRVIPKTSIESVWISVLICRRTDFIARHIYYYTHTLGLHSRFRFPGASHICWRSWSFTRILYNSCNKAKSRYMKLKQQKYSRTIKRDNDKDYKVIAVFYSSEIHELSSTSSLSIFWPWFLCNLIISSDFVIFSLFFRCSAPVANTFTLKRWKMCHDINI